MPPVTASGSLTMVTLPRLIARLRREGVSGTLFVDHEGGASRAYLREGLLAGAVVFARFKPLSQVLMDMGVLTIEDLDKSLGEMAKEPRLHGQVLLDMGLVTEDQLLAGLRRQHAHNIVELLRLREGTFRFEEGTELPDWTTDVSLSVEEAMQTLLADPTEADRVEALLGLLGEWPLCLGEEWGEGWQRFQMSRAQFDAVAKLTTPTTLDVLLAQVPGEEVSMTRLVAALSCFQLIRPA